jgi:hypothetical protein
MLEYLEFVQELQKLSTKTPNLVAKQQIISLIDKYQNKADEIDRSNFEQFHGEK